MAHTSPHQLTSAIKIPRPSSGPLQTRSPAFYAALPNRIRSSPMSVPYVQDSAPPPLPPPRWVENLTEGTDPGWEFENRANGINTAGHNSTPIKVGSSLLGGHQARTSRSYTGPERKVDFETKTSFPPAIGEFKSEGSDSSTDLRMPDLREVLEYNKLQSEKQMGQKTLERSSHAYDKQLLSRIGGPRTPSARPGETPAPASAGEEGATVVQKTNKKTNGQLKPLAMPERRHSDMDARSPQAQQWSASAGAAPPSSALSPRFSGLRSPLSEHGLEHSPGHPHQQRSSTMKPEEGQMAPGRLIHSNSYDTSFAEQQESSTRSPAVQQLNLHDRSPAGSEDYQQNQKTGQKRRAQSPPSESNVDPRFPNGSEAWQRRQIQSSLGRNNNANMARFQTPSSLSSTTSSLPQSASFASTSMLSNPSTATSYNSERLSPGAYQRSEAVGNVNNIPVHPPTRVDQNNPPPIPQRRATGSNIPRAPGLWICDCCPKKPKKFESEDELRIHEMEKQYICQYCHNRFKNKNEAERHQNSLHLRRHSWSCAALTSFEAAFHPTPSNSVIASIQGPNASNNPNDPTGTHLQHNPSAYPGALHSTPTDTCSYCGIEFVNPPSWDERVEHLNHVHKFGECNQSKKFFRADHFRQHLKHSHAGTSGKWTNMLENACMKDEPPPQPLGQPTLPPGMPGITMVGQQQLLAAAAAAAAEQGGVNMSGYGSPGMAQSSLGSPNMGMAQTMNQSMGQHMDQSVPQNMIQNMAQNMNQNMAQGMDQGLNQSLQQAGLPLGVQHQAGQSAMSNATGPMGGGGPPAPIASMMGVGMQQQQQQQSHGQGQ